MRVVRLSGAGARRLGEWAAGAVVGEHRSERALLRRMVEAGIAHPVAEGSSFGPGDVTVVVPVKDNRPGLERLLSRVHEVGAGVVVDDGSAVPVAESSVRHEVSRGPAAARNTGWRVAGTALVAFLDSDTVPDDGWLDNILPLFGDSGVAAVAPRIVSTGRGVIGRYEADRGSLDMGGDPADVRPDGQVRYVPSAALVIRREALEAVGGFDERLRFGEDVDLVWRLIDAGFSVRYQPDSIVRHETRPTLGGWLRQRFDYGTSAAPLAVRHPGMLACARIPRPFLAQCALASAGKPGLALAAAAVAGGQSAMRLRRSGIPLPDAAGVAATAQLRFAGRLGVAVRTLWWAPALVHRRTRRFVALSFAPIAAAGLIRGGVRWTVLRLLDDLAYGAGVWAGCLRHRSAEPLLPAVGPHRRAAR